MSTYLADQIYQFLDTTGDGTGSSDAAVNGVTTSVAFKIIRPFNMHLSRLILYLEDNANQFASGNYGAISTLANGISIAVHDAGDDSVLLDLTAGVNIQSNSHWGMFCHDVTEHRYGTGNDSLTARWTFTKDDPYQRGLLITPSQYFAVTINDDLEGLVEHRFQVRGDMERN